MTQPKLTILSLPPEIKSLIAKSCKRQDGVHLKGSDIPWQSESLNALFMTCHDFQAICAPLLFESLSLHQNLTDPTFVFDIVPQYGRHFDALSISGSRRSKYDEIELGTSFGMALALPNLRTMSMEAATFYEMFPHLRPSVAEGSTPAPPPPAYWRTFRQTARHITTLILYNFSELQAAAFLPFFPSLESLSISRFFREHDAPREDGTPFYTAVSNLDHLHTLKLSAPSLSYAKPDMRAPPSLRTLMFFPTDWSAATWHILEAFAPGLESLTVSTPSRSAGPPPILSLPRLQTLFTGSPTIIHALASSPLHYLSFLAHHNVRTLNAITDEMLFPFLPTLETVALDALLARDHPLEAALTALLERKPSLAIERPAPKSAVWADARRWFNPSWRPYDQNPSTEPPRYRDVEPEEQAGERREEGYQVAKGLLRFYDNLVERQYVQGDDVGLLTTLVNLSEANENAAWDRA